MSISCLWMQFEAWCWWKCQLSNYLSNYLSNTPLNCLINSLSVCLADFNIRSFSTGGKTLINPNICISYNYSQISSSFFQSSWIRNPPPHSGVLGEGQPKLIYSLNLLFMSDKAWPLKNLRKLLKQDFSTATLTTLSWGAAGAPNLFYMAVRIVLYI